MSTWAPLNATAEEDPDYDPQFPWYPYLFSESVGFKLEVYFATQEECREFIREVVLPAKEG